MCHQHKARNRSRAQAWSMCCPCMPICPELHKPGCLRHHHLAAASLWSPPMWQKPPSPFRVSVDFILLVIHSSNSTDLQHHHYCHYHISTITSRWAFTGVGLLFGGNVLVDVSSSSPSSHPLSKRCLCSQQSLPRFCFMHYMPSALARLSTCLDNPCLLSSPSPPCT